MSDDAPPPSDANEECVGPSSEQAGKASSCDGCPNQEACATGANRGPDPAVAEVSERMADIRHKLLVLSGKGGVGKSTVSAQLAWTLAESGFHTGVLDVDICGPSMPRMLGVESADVRRSNYGWSPVYASDTLACMSVAFMLSSRDDAIIWRGPRKNGLIKQFLTEVYWGDLDFLIVDAPPGTSDEHISIAQYLTTSHIDGAIIVTTPQEVALLDVRKEINFCKKTHIPILGVVENMAGYVCPCCDHVSDIFPALTGGAERMCEEMGVRFIGRIPLDPEVLRCCERGVSYLRGHEGTKAGKALRAVVMAVLDSNDGLRDTAKAHPIIGGEEEGEVAGKGQGKERTAAEGAKKLPADEEKAAPAPAPEAAV